MNGPKDPPPIRCSIFIDGLNLYFGVLKGQPHLKWLNIQSFCEELRPREQVEKIHYFSAIIDPRHHVSERRNRQKRYLEALKLLSKVTVTLGTYQDREVTCRADCKRRYRSPEEKKTDVNIAVAMIDCVVKNTADMIVLISGDSDLEPAVKWVRDNHKEKKVAVYIPALSSEQSKRKNHFYTTIGVPCKFLPLDSLEVHQMEHEIPVGNGKVISRPDHWK